MKIKKILMWTSWCFLSSIIGFMFMCWIINKPEEFIASVIMITFFGGFFYLTDRLFFN